MTAGLKDKAQPLTAEDRASLMSAWRIGGAAAVNEMLKEQLGIELRPEPWDGSEEHLDDSYADFDGTEHGEYVAVGALCNWGWKRGSGDGGEIGVGATLPLNFHNLMALLEGPEVSRIFPDFHPAFGFPPVMDPKPAGIEGREELGFAYTYPKDRSDRIRQFLISELRQVFDRLEASGDFLCLWDEREVYVAYFPRAFGTPTG